MTRAPKRPEPPLIRAVAFDLIDVPLDVYQRDFNAKHSQRIADQFDVNKCGILTLAVRDDGRYNIVDGQHRLHALIAIGYTEWPAEILSHADTAAEAATFVGRNRDIRRLSAMAAWRGRRVAQDPTVIAIESILSDLGLSVSASVSSRSLSAVSSLETIYATHGPSILADTLRIAHAAWADEAERFSGRLIVSLAAWLRYYRSHPNFDRGAVPKKFAMVTVLEVFRRTGARRGSTTSSATQAGTPAMLDVFTELFNHGRRTRELPEATKSGWRRIALGKEPW